MKAVFQSQPDLYGLFNEATVREWAASGDEETSETGFAIHVRSQASNFKMTVVNERFHKL